MTLALLKKAWWKYCLILAVLVLGCGGGGGIDDLASTGGGTGGTGISMGSVTGFGSIYVNGIHYDTGEADVFVEGQYQGTGDQAVRDYLAIGMVVRVEGDIVDSQNGTAYQVYFNDDIRGPVGSIREIDEYTTELVVLGKTILLQDITHTGALDIDTLGLDEWVQVSGFNDADGVLRASFIDATDSTAKANVKGAVDQLNLADSTFRIDGIVIDFSGAGGVGSSQLADGQRVEVTGTLSADHTILFAETIELIDVLGDTDAETMEMEGIVLEKPSDTLLSLDNITVAMDGQTELVNGELEELASDVRVEVEGELIDGVLYADRIIFLDNVKVESDVSVNDKVQSEISLAGLPAITIQYNEATKATGAAVFPDAITDLHHVKIIGRQTPQNTVLAVHIIVKNSQKSTVKVQGQLESDPGQVITVLGQSMDLTTIPDDNFESPEGVSVGYAGFLNSTAEGDLVSVKGERSGNDVEWQSISTD